MINLTLSPKWTYPALTRHPEMQSSDDKQPAPESTRHLSSADSRRGADYYYLLLATAGFFLAWIPILPIRWFDPDEFEHAHAAWYTFKGLIPYRDFFEHHTPWYYYTLRPLFGWFQVDSSFESARHFLIFGRGLSVLLAILSVLAVVEIGRLLENRKVGLLAGLLLVGQPVFFEKGIEIRPDVLALPFFLGGLCLLASRTFRKRGLLRPDVWGGSWRAASARVAPSCARRRCSSSFPGLLGGLGIWALFAGSKRLPRILAVACFLLGVAVPGVLTWAAFALHHGGAAFIANNFVLNAGWKQVVHEQLLKVLETSWPVLILCLLGSCAAVYRFFRSARRQYGELVLLSTLAWAHRWNPRRAGCAQTVLFDASAHGVLVCCQGYLLAHRAGEGERTHMAPGGRNRSLVRTTGSRPTRGIHLAK